MAEVKQVSGSFSISSSTKKPPSFSNNGVSSSFKHIYDDVFTTSPSRKLQSTLSFMEDDYAEVFGCSKSNNGCWSIPYSSVPIIDLPKENGLCNRGERVDYGGVFGGIDSDSFGLPDGEELFDQLKKKAKTSSTHTLPRSQGLTMEAADPGISNQSYGQLPTNGFCQSFDKSKHFDPRNNEPAVNATSKSRNSAHFRANSLQEVSTAQKTSTSNDDGQSPANVFCQSSENMNHFQHRNNVTAKNGPRKASHVRAYSLHEASGTQKTLSSGTPVIKDDGQSPTDGCCQSFDNMKQFEPGNNDIAMNATNGFREATHVRAYSSHEASATQETLSSETPVVKDSVQSPANGFCQSFDNTKHFEFRNNNMAANVTSRPGKAAAHVRAYSLHEASTTQTTLSGQMPVRKDDTFKVDSSFGKKQGKDSKHISLDLGANKQYGNGDAGLQKVSGSGMSESNLVDSSPGTCQPSKAAMNEPCQSFDNTTHSKFKTNNMSNNRISGATHAAGIHPIHESNDTLHEIGSTQKIVSSRTSVRNDDVTLPGIDVNLAEEKEKHSHNTCSDLGADRQTDVPGAGFQKVSGLHESTSIDSSHEACQASSEAGPSKVMKDDAEIAIGCNKVKKKGRRSRMASLDLSDCKDACEHDGGLQRKPRFGNSYSFDASHDPCAAHVKVQPSKMYPSSSLPQFFPMESHYKISENSSCKNSQQNMYEPLAEEFDVNSAAAVSAAALQRAIEEAEIRIRLAKEFLERERKGATKLRFKDTLKVKPAVAKENVVPNEINKFKQTNMDESFPPVESEMQPFPPSDQKHDTTNAQVAAVFEDENKFVKDGEFAERKDATVSESVREEDKCEGGEWEAAKHLNQIISGVKNRIASFMSWQTETEKKEILKENEANISQQRPDEVENESKAHEVFKERRTENNQGATRSTGEAMHEEERVQFAPEIAEPEAKESVRGFTVKPELGGKKVDLTPNSAEPSLGNFQFFAFRNQTVFEPLDSVEENKGHQENRMSETKNEEVQVTNEFKDEHLPFQSGEASPEQLNGKCVAHDSKTHDDVDIASDIGSSDAENNKAVEEPSSLAGLNETELSHERERQRDTNWKGSVCSINDEIAEMVEDLFSTVHDINEHTYEEDMQDDISRKSHKGFIMEENVEIAEEPYSLAGYDEKVLTDEEGRQDVMCRKSHLSSSDEEHDKIVEELYTQIGDGRINVAHEEDNGKYLNEEFGEESSDHSDYYESTTVKNDVDGECEVLKEAVNKCENVDIEEMDLGAESCESLEATEDEVGCQENERDEIKTSHIEETSGQTYKCEVIKPFRADDAVETEEKVTAQTSCVGSVEEGFKQNENLLSKPEQDSRFAESSSNVEDAVNPDDEIVNMIDITNTSEPEMDIDSSVSAERPSELIREDPVLSPLPTENIMEVDSNGIKEDLNDDIQNLQRENFISFDSETDTLGEKAVDLQSQDNLEDETDCWHESQENLHVEEFDTATDQDMETSGAEAVHRRRRWFDNRGTIATAERPSILEGSQTDLEIDQEILDESELAGSVEIHAGKLDSSAAEATSASEAEVSFNQDNGRTNNEVTPKRRRWFVKRGGEGVPEPLSLFEGVRVNLEAPLESTDENHETLVHKDTISGDCLDPLNTKSGESLNAVKTDVATNGEKGKQSGEAAPRRKRWFESRDRVGPGQQIGIDGDVGLAVEIDQESKAKGDAETHGKHGNIPILPEKDGVHNKVESKEHNSDMVEANRRGKEKEKEKLAVERAIREARERAFAEARERAKRDAAERPSAEARLRVSAGAEEKPCKVSSEGSSSSDKASAEAKLKAERAAVERATAEARERALQKALSDKSLNRSRENGGRYSNDRNSSLEPKHQSSRSSDASNNSEKYDGVDIESTQRRKARLERQKRTTERAAKALDEKNKRDLVAQEQAAKNMLADALDAEVRRWSAGKEGNLRALLSTLQYILGPDSGWQPVSLTDLVAATAVRKAYKKATLCVHPDKLQQRGASIQQKHICEKVFDLLKEAWGRFNPDER